MQKTCSFRVNGLVQGVFFRQSTQQQAKLLGVTGWVRNRSDGCVEGQATGDEKMLKTLRAWLNHGPAMATVLKLEWKETELQRFDGFCIRLS
ncbi:MAG: acylphosphatase [Gammaproteobacteria bacterium]|nr:acylphosphatase [Gammaproteobacteria bacterium]MCY4209461.1 acylphosphatase [Gammaproteobacteria bacterium]MCY4283331.1 acylphosphatase [Gammaproteobacteria bacterium]MCY4338427.1 acylphosphatase [Gammaproteobacteria bacterium]